MKNYSIVRVGNEYVVRADDRSVLKIASRRRAARLVTDAAQLLELQSASGAPARLSIVLDPADIPDPRKVP